MSESKHVVRGAALGLAILGTIAAAVLMTGNTAVAQTTPGNATSMLPPNHETSSGPSITLNPNSGGVGTNVTIAGTGFSTGQTFKFTFENGYMLTGNMIQDTMGRFSTTALIPQNATNGEHEIEVASSGGQNATATFTVGASSGNTTSTAPSGNMTTSSSAGPAGNETSPAAATAGNSTTITPSGNTTTPAKPE